MRNLIKLMIFALVVLSLACVLALCISAKSYVVDNEGIMEAYDEERLEDKLKGLSKEYECDLVFVTTKSFGSRSAQEYAEYYYDSNGYGYGSDDTGIIYVLSVAKREYYICTTGDATKIFKGNRMDYLESSILRCLQNDDFDGSGMEFASISDEILYSYHSKSIDDQAFTTGVIISVVVGVLAGIITIIILIVKMNNARPQKNAGLYIRNGSFNLTVSRDMYLYSTVRKVAKPKNNSSSGGRSGGSRGGRGGRF